MEVWDLKKIRENADIGAVANRLGIESYKKGSNVFVHCPIPEHCDEHPTNCFFKQGDSAMYCTVCNKAITAIDLVMYRTGKNVIDAAKEVWEIEGCPAWGKIISDDFAKTSKTEFFLKPEELRVLQIKFPCEGTLCWNDFVTEAELKKIVVSASKEQLNRFDRLDRLFRGKANFQGSLFEEERKVINKVLKRVRTK